MTSLPLPSPSCPTAPLPTTPASSVAARPLPSLAERFVRVRARTAALARPLSAEDQTAQSMALASPVKWHLAHTTWFFERFVLCAAQPHRKPYDARYEFLFNSYYDAVGARVPQAERGLLTRPGVAEVAAYREAVDREVAALLGGRGAELDGELRARLELGLQHEQQHQELILTDLLHLLAQNPLAPAYREDLGQPDPRGEPRETPTRFVEHPGGLLQIGHEPWGPGSGDGAPTDRAAFCFDNEAPRHRVWLEPFALADRLVTNGEFAQFVAEGGYDDPRHWLSEGFALAQSRGWRHPLHWVPLDGGFEVFTLAGRRPLDPAAPLCHVSYFEADAYARWRAAREPGIRLPSEAEWEVVCGALPVDPGERGCAESERHAPVAAGGGFADAFGQVWQWTTSAYRPYPGFGPWDGAFGEYNAKFMSGQQVLRGASIATPRDHARSTYRNFFAPDARWQYSGLRLARSATATRGTR
jgi:ergothioneine biosynthesis protein EgtB